MVDCCSGLMCCLKGERLSLLLDVGSVGDAGVVLIEEVARPLECCLSDTGLTRIALI